MSQSIPLRVLVSDTFDPWFNLATEDWIFRELDPKTRVLFLWRNSDTVVIGRFQNPWVECNTKKMEEDQVKLARRQSGGGAVFQDLGNTNFTFLTSKESFNKEDNNKIITSAISKFGLKALASGRNDIVLENRDGQKKISGSAFKEKRDRSFHHGTLLINANLTKLNDYLNPDKKKLTAKGIASVRSRVTNLSEHNSEITHQSLTDSIIREFFNHYQNECPIEHLEHESLTKIPSLNDYYQHLKDEKWRYGETPVFNHQMGARFEWGNMDVHLDVHKGVIEKSVIFSDSLHPEMVEELTALLRGQKYSLDGVDQAIGKAIKDLPFVETELKEFASWLKGEIS